MSSARVTHSVPGRMRVRVDASRLERKRALTALQEHCDGRVDCAVDARTGSALLTYDPDELDAAAVVALAQTADEVFTSLVLPAAHRLVGQPASETARSILDRFRRANHSVLLATDGRMDLRMLFPAALGGLAARQLLRQGVGLRSAPWYVLGYYAFDSYIKLHARELNGGNT